MPTSSGNLLPSYLRLFLLRAAFFALLLLPGQLVAQVVRGTVTDALAGLPLAGASVQLPLENPAIGTSTDENGNFRIENLAPGRYQLVVSFVAYQTYTLQEVQVISGKETVLQISLQMAMTELVEVNVTPTPESTPQQLGTRSISIEQTQRFAAANYDPARLAASFPGVTVADDQANHLVVRGNSPAGLAWRLEGVNILNPNHLANAGTFTDRAAPTGGGVNILSAQLLGTSAFYAGNYSAGYGNALAGLFDMHLRHGNNERREHTLQFSLLGLDFATEGPLSKNKIGSYLVNYRYSTVGLLSELGVQFGNEDINYQDLSLHLVLPVKSGRLTLFAIAGNNHNNFSPPEDSSTWETAKDLQDIRYKSEMLATGLTYARAIGGRTSWRSSVAFSALNNSRHSAFRNTAAANSAADKNTAYLFSVHSYFMRQLATNWQLQAGLVADYKREFTLAEKLPYALATNNRITYFLWQPYIKTNWKPLQRLEVELGFNYHYYSLNKDASPEPRARITYNLPKNRHLSLAAGYYSQIPPLQLVQAGSAAENRYNYRNLGFMRSRQVSLGYTTPVLTNVTLRTELYYQQLTNVPVGSIAGSTFSAVNLFDESVTEPLQSTGKAKNYGLEVSAEQPLLQNYYVLLSGTFYRSQYEDASSRERSTRFDGRYATSLTAGREWKFTRNNKPKEVGLHVRNFYRGGLRYTPVNEAESALQQQTVYLEEQAYERQLPDYFRLDVRVSLRTNRPSASHLVYLDIQNVTNRQNVAYRYYDTYLNRVNTRYQLGIIPVLGYRIEF